MVTNATWAAWLIALQEKQLVTRTFPLAIIDELGGVGHSPCREVIAFLRDKDYGQPLQFVNYR